MFGRINFGSAAAEILRCSSRHWRIANELAIQNTAIACHMLAQLPLMKVFWTHRWYKKDEVGF